MSGRQYTPEEARAILERAAELEHEAPDPGDSLSMDQLLAAGEEAGMDPALILRAANEVRPAGEITPHRERFHVLGGPAKIERRVVLQGLADLEVVADVLQDGFDDLGRVSIRGERLEWTSRGHNGRIIQATARHRDGETTIEVVEHLGGLIGGLFGGIGGGVGGGLGGGLAWLFAMLWGAVAAAVYVFGVVIASLLLARMIFGKVARRRAESVDRVVAELARIPEVRGNDVVLGLDEDSSDVEVERRDSASARRRGGDW